MTTKVFGYSSDGDARIYNLEDGEKLPEGWRSKPYPGFSRHWRDTARDQAPAKQSGDSEKQG